MSSLIPEQVNIPLHQRRLRIAKVRALTESMKAEGYNGSYPITLEADCLTLVDGGHRLAAAIQAGIGRIPYVVKPEGVSSIAHSLRCNRDGASTDEHDVFDLAELCWRLAGDGWVGQRIADELGWKSLSNVTQHKQIKELLCAIAWDMARGIHKDINFVKSEQKGVVNQRFTIVNWAESHFRALFKHLPWTSGDDIAAKSQAVIIKACQERAKKGKKLTAKWIGGEARRYGWYTKLEHYALGNLSEEVPENDRQGLIDSAYVNAFGKKQDDRNWQKFIVAVAALNERALGIKLYCGDAFEIVPELDDGSIALVATDPPYNVTSEGWDNIGTDKEYLAFTERWLESVRSKLADDYYLVLFCAKKYRADVEMVLRKGDWPILSRVTWWHKNMSRGRDVASRFIGASEEIFLCGTHNLNWPPKWSEERQDVQEFASPQSNFGEGKHHPTAKPVELFELLVRIGSKPGDTVLDLFAGGGTTGQACTNVGQRRCILIEKEEKFCQVIENRLGIKRQA